MIQIGSISDKIKLNNGVEIPWFGLGVWQTKEGQEVERAVEAALKTGYRLIDTAAAYGNEEGVGRALKASGVARNEVFVTTKVWNSNQGYDSTLRAFEDSRRKLGLDVVDLYLVHWPVAGKYKETYRALEKLYKDGLVRAIGVSNFQVHHLEDLLHSSEVVPAVNQVECHPLLNQRELRAFCDRANIKLQAWSPLMQGNLDVTVLNELAEKYFKTPAQIILRWDLQHGLLTIPKSVNPARIEENAALFDFELTEAEMASIDKLDRHHRFGPDPDNFNF
ncbi:glyoxal reductase [Paenibacillus darwinianus]|uniref:Glyoxal reductase n=1 Tax=Paenibacillus darwinianus TaxID=1380763 RepID=A0A9W5RZI2_9BACL|nr:aldo/keto reductase [Paenibacillus darwinianus]EXX85501.1 glyoxal reductase [Paenibacillus darwinianus]EXX85894.1 glyoxal reductase [Paenibacillus darwinianus]EXX86058.1 glyoxal reductase [Paenibacillus darwinianus]